MCNHMPSTGRPPLSTDMTVNSAPCNGMSCEGGEEPRRWLLPAPRLCPPCARPKKWKCPGEMGVFILFLARFRLQSYNLLEQAVIGREHGDLAWTKDLMEQRGKIVDPTPANFKLISFTRVSSRSSMPTSRRHCRARRAGTFASPIVCPSPTGTNVACLFAPCLYSLHPSLLASLFAPAP